MLTENRGVRLTLLGAVAATVVRVALCFVPQVPQSVADNIFWGVLGIFGTGVAGQKFADGMSRGATSTVNSRTSGIKENQ